MMDLNCDFGFLVGTKKTKIRPKNICPFCGGDCWTVEERAVEGYKTLLDFAIPCEACNGTGKKFFTPEEAKALSKKHGLPPRYAEKDFSAVNWDIWQQDFSEGRKLILDFVEHYHRWKVEYKKSFFFYSKSRGSGKTFLACVLANEITKKGDSVRFVPAVDLMDKITEKTKAERGSYTELDAICSCDFLILDDVSAQNSGKDYYSTSLMKVLDKRYGAGKLTLITSNVGIADLKLPDEIVDRIYSGTMEIAFPERSIRAIQAKQRNEEIKKEILMGA